MSNQKKYLGIMYDWLSLIQKNLIAKQQKMEELTMEDVKKMWELKGANGETVQMDLSWISSKADIDNLISAIDDLKAVVSEVQYGDITSLAESCASDWDSIGRDTNDRTIANVYGYKGNKVNIIIPAKINTSAYGILNARYSITSGGSSVDKSILGVAGVTKRIAFVGDFVKGASGYWNHIYADEFIGLEKYTGQSMSFSSDYQFAGVIHSNGLTNLDISKMSTTHYSDDIYSWYMKYPDKQFFLLTEKLDTPNLETVILPIAAEEAINKLIADDSYNLMAKLREKYPKFKGFIYK